MKGHRDYSSYSLVQKNQDVKRFVRVVKTLQCARIKAENSATLTALNTVLLGALGKYIRELMRRGRSRVHNLNPGESHTARNCPGLEQKSN